jgi:cell division protein FtsW
MKLPAIHAKGDRVIWAVVIVLSLVSVLAVYSSTGQLAHKMKGGNTEFYLIKQVALVTLGLALMYSVHLVHYGVFSRIGQVLMIISVPLLALTLTTAEVNSASRWLTIPFINLSFQTSDLAKLGLVMYLSRLLSRKQENIKDFKSAFLPLVIPILIICGLILPANFSTAALLFGTCFILLFIGGVNIKYLMAMMGIGIASLVLFIVIMLNFDMPGRIKTWKSRVENYLNIDAAEKGRKEENGASPKKDKKSDLNYQSTQAKVAIANGGLFGMGPGQSEQRNILPHPYSDFIFAIIIEEGGIIGGAIVVLMYLILFYRVVRMVKYSPQLFATFLAIGCTLLLLFQAFINMAVAVNLFPVTGQALPLVSMGGTSTLATSCAIGIILSISRHCVKDDKLKGKEVANAA